MHGGGGGVIMGFYSNKVTGGPAIPLAPWSPVGPLIPSDPGGPTGPPRPGGPCISHDITLHHITTFTILS